MRIQNKQRYLIRYLSIFALLISIVIAKTSCKKTDLLTNENSTQLNVRINQFFNLPSNVNPAIARVAKELERQNKKTGFISTLATQAGFPVWDKSSVKLINNNSTNSNSLLEDYEGSDTCILIPMVLIDANHVNAFISATIIDDSVTMRMYYKNDYKAYPFKATQPATGITTAEEFASQMILFDNAVFGYTTFQVKDKRLFHSTTNYSDTTGAKIEIKINDKQPTNGSNNLVYCTVQEYTASYCTTPDDDRCRGGCDNCGFPICWTVIWTQEHCTGGPGNGGGSGWPSSPPSGPGGTGGGGGPTGGGGNCVVGGLIIEGWAPPNPCYPPTGGNPLPPITLPPLNPCNFILQLQQDTAFMNKVKQLNRNQAFNLNYETGYTVNNRQTKDYVFKQGLPNAASIDWNIPYGTKVDGFMHCHYGGYRGLNNVFSADDIVYMARALVKGYVRDTANLFFIVTNKNDNPYLVKVNNVAKFIVFAKKIVGNSGDDQKKQNNFINRFNNKLNYGYFDKNTVNFLRMLESEVGNGLVLFRANDETTRWSKLRLTGQNNDDYSGDFCEEQ